MNLANLYKRFSRVEKELIVMAWDNRYNVALTPALFPFAEVMAVIMALEMFAGDLPRDDSWNAEVRRLIDRLMEFWRTGNGKDFHLPVYRKLEKKRKRRK